MRATGLVTVAVALLPLLALCPSRAKAESPWSAAASAGLAFPFGRSHGSSYTGAWVDLLHSAAPNLSIGAEGGWFGLAGDHVPTLSFAPGSREPMGSSRGMFSVSGVVRGRSPGPVRLHVLGTFGYYDLVTRAHFAAGDDQVEHQWSPGYSLGIGVSGSGPIRPGLQLRCHETLGPNHSNVNFVTVEAGLHFN